MTKIKNFDDYRALVDVVKMHDYRYFRLNCPTISDEEYDAMYFALQEYEEQHADEILPDSPTQQCYSENGNGKRTVARRTACLSMKKLHDAKSVVKYLRAQQKAANINGKGTEVDVEWKFDGETVSLVYRRGRLSEATYGHGKELFGIDCLDHMKYVNGVEGYVEQWKDEDRVELRGEVIISLEEFARYSKAGKSPRSTSNGIMSKKEAVPSECIHLEFHPFRLIADGVTLHYYAMDELAYRGFLTCGFVEQIDLGKSDDELTQDVERIVCTAEVEREKMPYPTDGLVFKFDNYDYYDRFGQTDHDAKYNCAFKFRPVFKAVTTYRGHHTTVGEKTGKVTYVADFDEVEMNGHRFAHANCGSERTFLQKCLTPGCKIEVSLHGDVIVCVDRKIEDEPAIDENLIIEEKPIIEEESIAIDEEPLVIDESEIVLHPEPHVIEQDINQSQEPEVESESTPQPKPKRKRNYPQVGEPTLREEREDNTARRTDGKLSVKKVFAGALAVLMAASMFVVVLAFAGAALFFLPMMGDVVKK
nr:MAG TPA: DNA ligase [Caudoviricetes sp.]